MVIRIDMKRTFLLFVLILSLTVIFSPIAFANLLYNGDFEISGEQGYTTGWTQEYNNNIFGASENPQNGIHHAQNHWDGGMYQNVSITSGIQYRLTGWAYIPSGEGGSPWGSYIGFYWLDEDGYLVMPLGWQADVHYLPRDQYNQVDSDFLTAPEGAVTAMVRFGTWSHDPWQPVAPTDFDNFDFSPIPEPSTLLLLGSGLFGLVGLARKKR